MKKNGKVLFALTENISAILTIFKPILSPRFGSMQTEWENENLFTCLKKELKLNYMKTIFPSFFSPLYKHFFFLVNFSIFSLVCCFAIVVQFLCYCCPFRIYFILFILKKKWWRFDGGEKTKLIPFCSFSLFAFLSFRFFNKK